MDTTDELEMRIQEKMALREERRNLKQRHTKRLMSELDERMRRYDTVANGLMERVICPRMERVKKCFTALNAPQCEKTRHNCKLLLKHTPQFPTTATLEIGVTHDGLAKTVTIEYVASILPLYVHLNGKGHLSMPLEELDEAKAAAWIDESVLQFVDAYLSVETTHQYHDENVVIDPVCGMSVNKIEARAEIVYQGATYVFCTEECRQKFAENPGRYLTGDSKGETLA
jgi:YHS domain-containing protein